MANYTDYKSLISQAITDFDSIFTKLKAKGVKYEGAALTTADAQYGADNKYLPTSKYADLIGQLDLVGGTVGNITGPKEGGSLTITPAAEGNTISIDIVVPERAVYEATASLFKSVAVVNKKFASVSSITDTAFEKIQTEGGVVTGYKFKSIYTGTPSLLNEVSVDAGSIGNLTATADLSGLKNDGATISLGTNTGFGTGVLTTAPGENVADYVAVNLTSSGKISGSIGLTAVSAPNFKEGYIESAAGLTASDVAISDQTVSGTGALYIKKAVVENITGAGVIKVATDSTSMIAGDSDESYDIRLTAGNTEADAKGTISASKNYTEGYVSAGTVESTITIEDKVIKIKKGSITAAKTAVDVTPGITTELKQATAAENSTFTIKVANPIADKTLADSLVLTPGYIKAATIPVPNITGAEQTITLAKGGISASVSVSEATLVGDTDIFATDTPANLDGYYKITPSAKASVGNATVSEGYVKDASQVNVTVASGDTAVTGDTKYIAKGNVVATANATITAAGDTEHTGLISLESTVPTSGHYYTLEITPSVDITPGYLKGTEKTETKSYKYIKEAVFNYVKSDTDASFIEVKQGGYVPSGLLNINDIMGGSTPDYASITIGTNSTIVSQTAPTAGELANYEVINLTSTVNAGYISDKNGTLTANPLYLRKATVTTSTALSSTAGDWTQSEVSGSKADGYKLTVSGKTVASATTTAGYIAAATDSYTSSKEFIKDVTLSAAELSVSGTAEVESTTVGGITLDAASTYKINSTLKASALTVSVGKAGYVGTEDGVSGSIAAAGITTASVGIKAGTGVATQDAETATVALGTNFDSTVAAGTNYTVSVTTSSVSATASLDEGYYGSTNKSITATKAITGSVSVAHGKLSSTVSADSLGLNTSDLVVFDSADTAASYIEITPTISQVSVNYNLTAGYIKTGDLDAAAKTLAIATTTTKKLRKYGAATTYIDPITKENVVAEVASAYDTEHAETLTPNSVKTAGGIVEDVTVKTAGTYVEKDIFIPLGANAAGTNVVTDLTRLQKRLAGQPLGA